MAEVSFERSKTVDFRHGYFTRLGGVSTGEFESLNVVARVGDSEENVAQNRALALDILRLKPENLAFLDFLDHGERILAVSDAARGMDFDHYDAIMTNQSSVILGVSSADCPVILLVSESAPAIALVHSGWRGTIVNIVPKTVQAMVEEYGVDPASLKAVIGPYIHAENYEVGPEVAAQFEERYVRNEKNRLFLDLGLCIEDQLVEAGVQQIDNLHIDTFSDNRFYSHRRDKGKTGRFLSVASL